MTTIESLSERVNWKAIVLASLFGCFLSFGFLQWGNLRARQITEEHFLTDQTNPEAVAEAFLFAMADKRYVLMRSYVVDERW